MARPAKRSRRSREDARVARQRTQGYIKLAIALLVVAGFGITYAVVSRSNRDLDETTLRPDKPSSITVLLVDVTDPMNLAQRQDFQNQLVRLRNSIPRYGQFSVVRVDATGSDLLKPVIVRCNPGTSADTDQFRGNPAKLQRQWTEGFERPLDEAFRSVESASGADQSPIMESIQSAALTELQKPGQEELPKRLIVASDLLQNTSAITFYGSLPDGDALVRSDAFRRVRTDLRGVTIELWQLERDDAGTTQPRALSELWERAIQDQGGNVSRIYNVSG